MVKYTKTNRVLMIYSKLLRGEQVNKKKLAKYFNVSDKSIQRDINDIKAYFCDLRDYEVGNQILYNRKKNTYYMKKTDSKLTKQDVLVLNKILLESRALCREELIHMSKVLLYQVDKDQREEVEYLIRNEIHKYSPLKHGEFLILKIWELSKFIREKKIIEISYIRADGKNVNRVIKPVSIIFSEYYFYLLAYFGEYESPSIFRIDRIVEYKYLGEKFKIPYAKRFEEGEFRKRIQFMYPGKLIKVRFEFMGTNLQAVLDRLPTAEVISKDEDKVTIEAEVYGKGILMWFLSQGSFIRVISPEGLVEDIKKEVEKLYSLYS